MHFKLSQLAENDGFEGSNVFYGLWLGVVVDEA